VSAAGSWEGRRRLGLGHSLDERCAECDRILGDLNVLTIDGVDASWCLGCVEDFVRRARAMEDEHLTRTGGPFLPPADGGRSQT
jgi:hypothetical protein